MAYHHFIMFAAGVGVPIFAAMNAKLGQGLGSPALATMAMFVIATLATGMVVATTGFQGIAKLASAPKFLFLAGGLMVFYLLSITWIAPIIGLGNAIFLVLIGQLCAAAAIDQFGLFGAQQTTISATRAAGLALMASGVFLVQKA